MRVKTLHVVVFDRRNLLRFFVAQNRTMRQNNSSINRSTKQEYKDVMVTIRNLVSAHKSSLVPGEPQFNFCDEAVMVRQ